MLNRSNEKFDHYQKTKIMDQTEKDKADYLANQFKYAGIEGVTDQQLRALINSKEDTPTVHHTMFYGKDGKQVAPEQEHHSRIDMVLKCRSDKENGRIYFNRYEGAISNEKLKEPLLVGVNVSYRNTYKPSELVKMANSESAINRDFINSKTSEVYNSWAFIDFKNTDNQGNALIRKKNIDVDKVIRESGIVGKENPYVRAAIKDMFRNGERASAELEVNGEKKEVLVKLNPRFNSLNYFDKDTGIVVRQTPGKAIKPVQEGQEMELSGSNQTVKEKGEDKGEDLGKEKKVRTTRSRKVV